MNFQQLRIIRETARCNFNLTEVANALLTSQSGVSKHVKDFEDELGVELFVRRGKRLLGLTDAGKEAVEIVERMLIDAQNLAQIGGRLSSADEGTLRIVTTHTQARYTLPPIIARFKQAFPHVRLALNQASPRDIAAILLEGETDIGLATDTMENTTGLVTFPYFTWEHAVIVPAGHPLEQASPLTLEDVAEWPIITYDEGLTGRTRIDDAFAREGIVPDIAISALDADVINPTSSWEWASASSPPWPSTRSATPSCAGWTARASLKVTRPASAYAAGATCAATSTALSSYARLPSPKRWCARRYNRRPTRSVLELRQQRVELGETLQSGAQQAYGAGRARRIRPVEGERLLVKFARRLLVRQPGALRLDQQLLSRPTPAARRHSGICRQACDRSPFPWRARSRRHHRARRCGTG